MKTTVLIFASLVFCLVARANAACSSDLKTHVALGMAFLREAKAYEARNETDLAAAEWENLGHQVEVIGGADSPESLECDDETLNRQYYLIASWDEFKQIMSGTQDKAQVSPEDARLFRQLVSILYKFDGDRYYRADYLTLKLNVHAVYDLASIPYCSPEQKDDACERLARRCPVAASPATLLKTVQPDYPDWATKDLSDLGMGRVMLQVIVSLDAQGHVLSAAVGKNSVASTASEEIGQAMTALDLALVTAARASTYRPAVEHCEPVPSTFIFSGDLDTSE